MASPQISGHPSVSLHLVSGEDLRNPWADFFQIPHTHPLTGEMCLLGLMTFDLPEWPTVSHNYFNMPDICRTMPDS